MIEAYTAVGNAEYQLHIHAVGDGAVQLSLDALQRSQKITGKRDARHSLAHVELATKYDINRMNKLGITTDLTTSGSVSMLPASSNKMTNEIITNNKNTYESPLKSLIDAGVNVAIASDYATSDSNTMASISGAITLNGAKENFLEDQIGSFEVGKTADIVVLNKNLFKINTKDIPNVKIEMTLFRR